MRALKTVKITEDEKDYLSREEGVLKLLKTPEGYRAGIFLIEDPDSCEREYLEKVYNRCIDEPLTIAETEHLLIREFAASDAKALYEIIKEPEVMQFAEYPDDDFDTFTDKLESYRIAYRYFDCGMWGMFLKESGKLIGTCGINYASVDGEQVLELGYFISSQYSGKGYTFEAAKSAVDVAFKMPGQDRVYARVRRDNARSVRLLERLGFRFVKQLKDKKGFDLYEIKNGKSQEIMPDDAF
jgi:RimJ/RimL family protein N-acetyltransferase